MEADFSSFLARHAAVVTESVAWGDLFRFHVASYLWDEVPPLGFATSVRGIVLVNGLVLVQQGLCLSGEGADDEGDGLLGVLAVAAEAGGVARGTDRLIHVGASGDPVTKIPRCPRFSAVPAPQLVSFCPGFLSPRRPLRRLRLPPPRLLPRARPPLRRSPRNPLGRCQGPRPR